MGVNDTIFHILAGRVFFPCFLSLSKYQGVGRIRDSYAQQSHSRGGFTQLLRMSRRGYVNNDKVLYCFYREIFL